MDFVRRLARPLTPFFGLCFLLMIVQTPARAEMVGTDQIVNNAKQRALRAKIMQFYDRQDVKKSLQKHGLSTIEAKARIAQLSDSEVQMLAKKIDKMPAGAGTGETILIVFLVLIILELMKVTNIFSFI